MKLWLQEFGTPVPISSDKVRERLRIRLASPQMREMQIFKLFQRHNGAVKEQQDILSYYDGNDSRGYVLHSTNLVVALLETLLADRE